MPYRLAHTPHSKSTSSPALKQPSCFVHLLKSLFTLYLLCAITYTAFLFLSPLASLAFSSSRRSASVAKELSLHPLHSSSSFRSPHFSPPEIEVRPLPDGSTGEDVKYSEKRKKPLKGAAVDSAEVKAEDMGSIWATKKGAKQKGAKTAAAAGGAPSNARHLAAQRTHDGAVVPPRAALEGFDPSLSSLAWHPPSHPLAQSTSSRPPTTFPSGVRGESELTAEDFFLNKVFGEALGPSKVVPYYYRATGPRAEGGRKGGIAKEDITITTLVTSNRFKVFEKLVEHYQGPISATVHVSNNPTILQPLLAALDDLYVSSIYMSVWVDIHLVIDSFDRQFNMWRNVAKFFARTDYVMMLDVDFWLCTNFRSRILASPSIMARLREGTAAFVIPAFEFTKQSDGVDPSKFPTTKKDLISLVNEGKLGMFHKSWQPGHGATNYTRYYEARKGEVYRAQGYTHSYEPYVVFKKEGTPFCDERFIGYGGNKAACLFELYLSGVSFYILPEDFVIHQSHAYAEAARKHERRYNRKLYADFREETCFRYLTGMVEAGTVGGQRAKNMLTECKKIKGFSTAASQLIAAYISDSMALS